MADLKIGFATLVMEDPDTGTAPSWASTKQSALLAEHLGFDTFWVPDELVWEDQEKEQITGFWECVAITSAAAEATSTIAIGTWVLSALHRGPGLTVKAAETIDEISGGRLIFGLGAGHAGRQGAMFGIPPDRVVGRYEDALSIIVPLLREGYADHHGEYHFAERLPNRPRGPQGSRIPLMLAGHGPRTIGLAVRLADIWSGYATSSSQPEAFQDMIDLVHRTCDEQGRDPATLGASIGIGVVAPGSEIGPVWKDSNPLMGSTEQIAEKLLKFHQMGFTSVELTMDGDPVEALPALGEVVALVKNA